ncbi:Ig-like domain-containing protein [Aquisphaera insulae]|uniref:Ig-like domain-containing protein n=1 Tax=Aquisphaera insulae TaxID=2712864 RepID=UPI0013EDE4D8|nr:Ig-like domain-containing protein [Aquisphaera insulae]
MEPSGTAPRTKRAQEFALERLDDRQLLSAGMGNTFAIIPGTVSKAGEITSIQFKIDPSRFTAPRKGKIILGIDVASSDSSSAFRPYIVSVKTPSGQTIMAQHAIYSKTLVKSKKLASAVSSATLVTLPVPKAGQAAGVYTLQVEGASKTTGNFLTGFYLPGDTTGSGEVTTTGLQTIVSELGQSSSGSKYTFDADSNRDGKITMSDVAIASRNLGAKTTISPVVDVNLAQTSDSDLQDRITSQRNVVFTGTVSPGASVTFSEINKNSAGASGVADSSGNYNITVPLGDGSNTFQVTTMDSFGQSISGQISPVTWSANPPKVVNTPSDLATKTT